jgi:hypothetical protein
MDTGAILLLASTRECRIPGQELDGRGRHKM